MSRSKYFGICSKLVTLSISTQYYDKNRERSKDQWSGSTHIVKLIYKLTAWAPWLQCKCSPLPVAEAMQQQTSLWSVSDHRAVFSSPLQSGPFSCTKIKPCYHHKIIQETNLLFCVEHDKQALTLFPEPLPTGGWHSQACRMAQSMISTRAVSWRSVRAKNHRQVKLLTCNVCVRLDFLISHTGAENVNQQRVWGCCLLPSSPGMGSSSNRLIIVSQSFSSSDPQSHKLSTK